jgi:hypothetical protein
MTRILADETLLSKLRNLSEPLELVNNAGRVIGRVVPVEDCSDVVDLSKWEPVGPDVTEEELDRRERSDKWYTTQEVLDHLRNLEKQ